MHSKKLLRFTYLYTQSAFHDGKQPNWFHKDCFFKKQRPASEAVIDGFNKLRSDDQKDIKENLGKKMSLPMIRIESIEIYCCLYVFQKVIVAVP